jgi:hypothetical protein
MWLRRCLLFRKKKLQMFKNKVLRRTFGPKRNAVDGLNSMFHTEELRHLECSKVFPGSSDQGNYASRTRRQWIYKEFCWEKNLLKSSRLDNGNSKVNLRNRDCEVVNGIDRLTIGGSNPTRGIYVCPRCSPILRRQPTLLSQEIYQLYECVFKFCCKMRQRGHVPRWRGGEKCWEYLDQREMNCQANTEY